jgi:predicted DNA-binding transcriptional regulator YafY
VINLDDTWIENAPAFGVVPSLSRKVDPFLLKRLIACIKAKTSIEIEYQSMYALPHEDVWRRITPHAFGFDGLRWHVRSFCHRDRKFRDFIVSRCTCLRNEAAKGADADDDTDWNTFFEVVLEPNPVLTAGQQKAIEIDYGMERSQLSVSVRHALLYYFEKRLRLDVGSIDTPAQTPIVIKNKKEFETLMGKITSSNNELKK